MDKEDLQSCFLIISSVTVVPACWRRASSSTSTSSSSRLKIDVIAATICFGNEPRNMPIKSPEYLLNWGHLVDKDAQFALEVPLCAFCSRDRRPLGQARALPDDRHVEGAPVGAPLAASGLGVGWRRARRCRCCWQQLPPAAP